MVWICDTNETISVDLAPFCNRIWTSIATHPAEGFDVHDAPIVSQAVEGQLRAHWFWTCPSLGVHMKRSSLRLTSTARLPSASDER